MKSKSDYIEYKPGKADDSIYAAKVLLDNQLYADAITKIYYAAFHAISALLIEKNLNPKTHTGVKSLFHKEFIFTGIIYKDFAELLMHYLQKDLRPITKHLLLLMQKKFRASISKH